MPYITNSERDEVERLGPQSPGQLNYAITVLIRDYLTRVGVSYTNLNAIASTAKRIEGELQRRRRYSHPPDLPELWDDMWRVLRSYHDTNDTKVAVIHMALHEMNRRVTDRYEDKKRRLNGDVWLP